MQLKLELPQSLVRSILEGNGSITITGPSVELIPVLSLPCTWGVCIGCTWLTASDDGGISTQGDGMLPECDDDKIPR